MAPAPDSPKQPKEDSQPKEPKEVWAPWLRTSAGEPVAVPSTPRRAPAPTLGEAAAPSDEPPAEPPHEAPPGTALAEIVELSTTKSSRAVRFAQRLKEVEHSAEHKVAASVGAGLERTRSGLQKVASAADGLCVNMIGRKHLVSTRSGSNLFQEARRRMSLATRDRIAQALRLSAGDLVLYRDRVDIQPTASLYRRAKSIDAELSIAMANKRPIHLRRRSDARPPGRRTVAKRENIYELLPPAQWAPYHADPWRPVPEEEAEAVFSMSQPEEPEKGPTLAAYLKRAVSHVLDHNLMLGLILIMTFWALFFDDLLNAIPMDKSAEIPGAWVTFIFLLLFALRSIVQYDEYFLSFFWWVELVANFDMVLTVVPLYHPETYSMCETTGDFLSTLSGLQSASRLARVLRLMRVLRIVRIFDGCSRKHKRLMMVGHRNRERRPSWRTTSRRMSLPPALERFASLGRIISGWSPSSRQLVESSRQLVSSIATRRSSADTVSNARRSSLVGAPSWVRRSSAAAGARATDRRELPTPEPSWVRRSSAAARATNSAIRVSTAALSEGSAHSPKAGEAAAAGEESSAAGPSASRRCSLGGLSLVRKWAVSGSRKRIGPQSPVSPGAAGSPQVWSAEDLESPAGEGMGEGSRRGRLARLRMRRGRGRVAAADGSPQRRVGRRVSAMANDDEAPVQFVREGMRQRVRVKSLIGKHLNERLVRSMMLITIILMCGFPLLTYDEVNSAPQLGFSMLVEAPTHSAELFEQMLFAYKRQNENFFDDIDGVPRLGYLRLLKIDVNGSRRIWMRDGSTINGSCTDIGHDMSKPPCAALDGLSYADLCFEAGTANFFDGCPPGIASLRCKYLHIVTVGTSKAYWDRKLLSQRTAWYNVVNTLLLITIILTMYIVISNDVAVLVVQPLETMVSFVHELATNPLKDLETLTSKSSNRLERRLETTSIKRALAKIVGLMQLGFGGAGHEIIASNLANSDSDDLDLMRLGVAKDCAYGFCDIRQFTDTVECLQDQVMIFTNSVGYIIHQACHANRGEPNKNIGDAFLVVWRPRCGSKGQLPQEPSKIVDGALTSFRRCVREVATSAALQLITDVPSIHEKWGQGKYRTRLGFGLHFGWSVEGPVGSPTKIDCSYLSPEVKVSDRLEAATKIYSCNVLMSGQFYDLLSDHMKEGVRLIDHITLKGGHRPYRVYTCDRSNLWLKISPKMVRVYGAGAAYEQFAANYHTAIDAFIQGEWVAAQQSLLACADFCPEDVPTKRLLAKMRELSIGADGGLVPPLDWKGYYESEV